MRPTGILVYMPAYGSQNMAVTTQSLYNLAAYLTAVKIDHALTWVSAADIEDIRNLAVTAWYDGHPEYSHLLFVDADMGFPSHPEAGKPNLIRDMIAFDKPVMGCFYAKRQQEPEVVGTADPHELKDLQKGFLKVTGMGCGVMMIERSVITKMLETIPHISDKITSLLARGVPDLKLTRIIGAFSKLHTDERMVNEARINNELLAALGRSEPIEEAVSTWMKELGENRSRPARSLRLSEDMAFCWRWINQCGGEIWANVNHRISHVGSFDYAIRYQGILEAKDDAKKAAA